MQVTARTTLDWLLAYNTTQVTAEELYNASWEGPLDHSDAGFRQRYERLAEAINAITGMYSHGDYPGDDKTKTEAGRGL